MRAASSVDRFRRSLLLAAPALLLGACAPTGAAASGLDGSARALNERLAAEDEPGFLAGFAPGPGAQALGRRMFATLSRAPAAIAATAAGRLRVSWGLPGEPPLCSEASADLIAGRIANLAAASSGTEWLGEPLGVRSAPNLVVAAGSAGRLSRWSRAAEAALTALNRVVPAGRNWAEPVVVLVPDDLAGFAAYAGRGADRTGAVTVVPGTPDSEGVRVVVNPAVRQKSADDQALIAHEAVHAWMRSPRLTGTPGWLVEGIAEAFTAAAYPQVAAANRRLAKDAVAAGGVPAALPEVRDAGPATYALAQVAAQAMAGRLGWPAVLDEADARTSGGARVTDATVLGWYKTALAAL